jgi:hypothetical protein
MGLCGSCFQQRPVRSGRGSHFSMCERGLRGEAGYVKYPRLPVTRCNGWEHLNREIEPELDPRD